MAPSRLGRGILPRSALVRRCVCRVSDRARHADCTAPPWCFAQSSSAREKARGLLVGDAITSGVRRPTVQAVRPDTLAKPPAVAAGIMLGGKYRLEEAIARGGMARVWRAQHVMLNRPVAVKFLDGVSASQTETFLHEAKVAASVRHKNIVDIIDFGLLEPEDGSEHEPYMVMELLEGETLEDRLRGESMSVPEIIAIAVEVLSGLDAVHRASIVHRDLKPANIFLTADDDGVFVRLLDFGISQGADWVEAGSRIIVGTPEYMSPEQAFGDPIDLRTDIYSLGIVLYEMFSGVVPFTGPDPGTILTRIVNIPAVPLSTLRADIPEIAAVIERAMAYHAEARWGGAREMRLALLAAVGAARDSGVHEVLAPSARVRALEAIAYQAHTEVAMAAVTSKVDDGPEAHELSAILGGWRVTARTAVAIGVGVAMLLTLALALGAFNRNASGETARPSATTADVPVTVTPVPAVMTTLPAAGLDAPPGSDEAANSAADEAATPPRARPRPRASRPAEGAIRRDLDF